MVNEPVGRGYEMAMGYGGTYKAVVVDNADPMGQSRLMVRVPDVGLESAWANPLSGSSGDRVPAVGDEVMIQFEGGDSDRPVWDRDGAAVSVSTTYGGVYRAIVIDNLDPAQSHRLQVQVPDVLGSDPVWAVAAASLGSISEVPAIGTGVWVQFDGGDPNRPEWTGVQ
jgi:Type VI secretion system/phage-baseplate injector OB domain